MGVYYVSPSEQTDLEIDQARLDENLRERWPDASIHEVKDPASKCSLEWTIQMTHSAVEGLLDDTRQMVRLDGDIRDCAEFALWLRPQIDGKYKLLFYDQGFEADVDLSEYRTPEQIVEVFG